LISFCFYAIFNIIKLIPIIIISASKNTLSAINSNLLSFGDRIDKYDKKQETINNMKGQKERYRLLTGIRGD
jgi:hypothetical protein